MKKERGQFTITTGTILPPGQGRGGREEKSDIAVHYWGRLTGVLYIERNRTQGKLLKIGWGDRWENTSLVRWGRGRCAGREMQSEAKGGG